MTTSSRAAATTTSSLCLTRCPRCVHPRTSGGGWKRFKLTFRAGPCDPPADAVASLHGPRRSRQSDRLESASAWCPRERRRNGRSEAALLEHPHRQPAPRGRYRQSGEQTCSLSFYNIMSAGADVDASRMVRFGRSATCCLAKTRTSSSRRTGSRPGKRRTKSSSGVTLLCSRLHNSPVTHSA